MKLKHQFVLRTNKSLGIIKLLPGSWQKWADCVVANQVPHVGGTWKLNNLKSIVNKLVIIKFIKKIIAKKITKLSKIVQESIFWIDM